jgi:type II secretory pathway pseudopilin PulG
MIPVAAIGIIAAVAIPAFLDYMKKSKRTESGENLYRIGKSLKRYYGENATFPVGDAAAIPDFPTCCGLRSAGGGVDNKCPNSPAAWKKDKIWSALEFEIDEPTMYRYTYHSDGKTAVVKAIGDLDCDGNFATFELDVGTTKDGNPTATLVKPAAGTY